MMRYLCVLLFTAFALAEQLRYAVIAPGASSVSVNIGGTVYGLAATEIPGVDYFTANITATTTSNYFYIADGNSETFSRIFPSGKTSTYNDFFGRDQTLLDTIQLGWPFEDKQQWNRSLGTNGVFNDNYISTLIFLGDRATDIFLNTHMKSQFENISAVMFNRANYGFWTDAELNIEDTSQLKPNMKLGLADKYRKRSNYKLRPSSSDPVFIRDKLYNEILQAIGCPHSEASFIRVYVNSVGLGLYNLQEHPGSKNFVKNEFYGAKGVPEPDPIGTPLDCTTGADFTPDVVLAAFEAPTNQSNAVITYLINALTALDATSDAAIAEFDRTWFSIDHFFRAMAVEYLSGHYDSYWFFTTNFVIYNDPTEGTPGIGRFYFIDQDFDQTFGVNLSPLYNPYGANYTRVPYTDYVNKNWSLTDYDAPHRTMIDKLLSNPTYKAKFEDTLKTIVKGVWNPIALNRRIDAIVGRIRPDIEWDYTLGANRAHLGNATYALVWSLDDFNNGFDNSIGGNWGLKTYISERANYVAESFGIQFQNPPLEPPVDPNGDDNGNDGSDGNDGTTDGSSTSSGTSGTSGTIGSSTGSINQENSAAKVGSLALLALLAALLTALAL